jgi:hypothetical protein
MNPFTALVWEVLQDSPEFLGRLTAIMQRDHKPFSFVSGEKAFQANAKMLEGYVRGELDKWYEWLPDIPINRIGGRLAVEMLDCVDWDHLARIVQEHILRTKLAKLTVPNLSTTP